MKVRALILDRDGVINTDKHYLHKIEDFSFIEGIVDALKYFAEKGYVLIIVTNQSGIARGYYTEEDFQRLTEWMLQQFLDQGVYITKVYYSPYHAEHGLGKYKKDSFCRKPNPGMILAAQEEFNLDLKNSILVGDNESDIEAGINAGIKTNILLKSYTSDFKETKATFIIDSIEELVQIHRGKKDFF